MTIEQIQVFIPDDIAETSGNLDEFDASGYVDGFGKWILAVPVEVVQAIADAPKCKHGRIDIHFAQHQMHDSFGNEIRPHEYTCKGAPELRSLLEDLNKENNK